MYVPLHLEIPNVSGEPWAACDQVGTSLVAALKGPAEPGVGAAGAGLTPGYVWGLLRGR